MTHKQSLQAIPYDLTNPVDRKALTNKANRLLKSGSLKSSAKPTRKSKDDERFDPGNKFKFHGDAKRFRFMRMAKRLSSGLGKPRDYKQARNDKSFIKYLNIIGLSHIVGLAFEMRAKS